jgi:hypothetical protein
VIDRMARAAKVSTYSQHRCACSDVLCWIVHLRRLHCRCVAQTNINDHSIAPCCVGVTCRRWMQGQP